MADRTLIERALGALRNSSLPPLSRRLGERMILTGELADGVPATELDFLGLATAVPSLELVSALRPLLGAHFEEALISNLTGDRTVVTHCLQYQLIDRLVSEADRDRLRQAGQPMPENLRGGIRFDVYRGVGGTGRYRRVKGYWWTADLERALWFAGRARQARYADPAVYALGITEADVLVWTDERGEREFVIDRLRVRRRPRRLPINLDRSRAWPVTDRRGDH